MTLKYRRPTNVAVVVDPTDDGDVVYLTALPHGSLLVLRASSALIWQEAVAADDTDVVSRLAELVETEPEAIRGDVESFVGELLQRRLLEPADGWGR